MTRDDLALLQRARDSGSRDAAFWAISLAIDLLNRVPVAADASRQHLVEALEPHRSMERTQEKV